MKANTKGILTDLSWIFIVNLLLGQIHFWVNDDIYSFMQDYLPNKTNHFVEMFYTGKNSVFLINVPSMYHLDKEFYFDKNIAKNMI